jgi:signal transduction histidine kinase
VGIRDWLDWQRRSMVSRLLFLAILVVAVGFALRIGILLPFIREQLVQQSSAHQLAIAGYVAQDIGAKLRAREDFLERIAGQLPVPLLADPDALEGWLKARHEINPLFSGGLLVLPVSGRGAVADFPVLAGRREVDFSRSDYFGRALAERRTVIGTPQRGQASGTPILVVATPVLDHNRRARAILAGVTALAAPGFLNLLQETRLGETGGFHLVAPADNLVVAATDQGSVLTALPRPGQDAMHDRAMAGYRGAGVAVDSRGIEELSTVVSVPGFDWFLVARVPTAEVQHALGAASSFLVQNALIVLTVVLVAGGLALRRFFRPLTSTARLIHRMAAGEIEVQPVPVGRRDEVGELAEGFNFLVNRLQQSSAEKLRAEHLRIAEKERMEQSLRQWMADTSHELRTPIAVLRAQIEAIHDGINPVDARTLGVLHGEVMGLSRLVDDLHTLARSDVGRLDLLVTPIAPFDLLDDVVFAFRDRIAAAGLSIELRGCPSTEPVVSGDAVHLRQVFANLLENSLRYTDSGGRIRISCLADGAAAAIRFEDSPPGVPEAALPRLFDRFFRVEASRSRKRGGSGIGLAVCQSIVQAHGGSIQASPSPLGGLGVTVSFPLSGG